MMRNLLFHNYVTSFASNIANVGIGLVTSVLISRSLGPIGRGEIAAALLWPSLLSYLGNLGIVDATMYYASRPGASIKDIHFNAVVMALLQSAILIPVSFVVMPALLASQRPAVIEYSRLYLLVIPVTIIGQLSISVLRAQMHIMTTNLLGLVIPVGYFISVVFFLLTQSLSLQSVVICQLVFNTLAMILTIIAFGIHRIPLGLSVRFSMIRQLWGYGVKVHLGTIFSAANLRLDQVLLAAWATPEQLGWYVVAVSVSNFLLLLPRAISNVLTPSVSRLADPTAQHEQFTRTFQRFWFASLGSALIMAVLMYPAITLVYGSEFAGAVLPAEILVIAATIWGLKEVMAGGARALNDPLLPSRAELLSSAFTITMLIIFLPRYGIVGAAVISVLAYGISFALITRGLRRHHHFSLVELFRLDKPLRFFSRRLLSTLFARGNEIRN